MVRVPDPGVVTASRVAVAAAGVRAGVNSRTPVASPTAILADRVLLGRPLADTRHLPDAVVVGVADVDRPVGTDHRAVRAVEIGPCRRATVPAPTLLPTGDRGDVAGAAGRAARRVGFAIHLP